MISSLPALQEFISIKRVCYLYVFDSLLYFSWILFLSGQRQSLLYIMLLLNQWMKMQQWLSSRESRLVLETKMFNLKLCTKKLFCKSFHLLINYKWPRILCTYKREGCELSLLQWNNRVFVLRKQMHANTMGGFNG